MQQPVGKMRLMVRLCFGLRTLSLSTWLCRSSMFGGNRALLGLHRGSSHGSNASTCSRHEGSILQEFLAIQVFTQEYKVKTLMKAVVGG